MSSDQVVDPENRFTFGKNWAQFLEHLTDDRIEEAVKSLQEKLEARDLTGKTFLDIGSGSGLFSLAAYRMGAVVQSFDYDTDSVQCATHLRDKYCHDLQQWRLDQGSVLDANYLKKYGQADIVYSWVVLHHTGHMYRAFENVAPLVKSGGKLFVAIYNDQGSASQVWKTIKKIYVSSPQLLQRIIALLCLIRLWGPTSVRDIFKGKPFHTWKEYKINRGMSAWYDVVDWVGGYPFEVAKPEEVFNFFKNQGFTLQALATCGGGLGCNEFVFLKK